MNKKRLLVFASGEPTPGHGGSGFKNLVLKSRQGFLNADIVAVVSNHPAGGVRDKAVDELNIPFIHMPKPYSAEAYRRIVSECQAEFIALSGWLLPVRGLDSKKTFNIHPADLPDFGGKGMHGDLAHQAIIEAFERGKIHETAICMHFVTDFSSGGYDTGPLFFRYPIPLIEGDTVESLRSRVNAAEHICQPLITNLVLNGVIGWDGINRSTLTTPFLLEAV